MMKWSLVAFYLGLVVAFEALALYSLRQYTVTNKALSYLVAVVVYGLVVTYLLVKLIELNGLGMANFFWNIFSTMAGFVIGVYMFNESAATMQWVGVALGLLGFTLIVLGDTSQKTLSSP
jgi:multidrug transporter EmrE-like cation transporter